MAHIYSAKIEQENRPKKETIQFLLQYSKALKVYRTKGVKVELILN